ncbi:hypothetical protein AAVH_08162 [Aphelenchoides avenae]|nr:hypothetical protein AAVH_08162 [Aphelenchus avenae]
MNKMLMIAAAMLLGLAICVVLADDDGPPEVDVGADLVVEPVDLPLPDQPDEDLGPIEFIDLPLPDAEGGGR